MRADVAMADYILVRVFTEEKRALKETAREKGVSLSEFIRTRAMGGPKLGGSANGAS
ncbi:plasmid mobilization protein [Brucella anthropi]|uniref:plasmid mobilization protein n=1 Tax=Brucella anthropi TaxID=529 RepID=UPI00178C193F|nr:hypothetical protein [Brucella anthropi]UVV67030.1 hypothetical protein NW321_11195 [Brucella anthropi]